MEPTTAIATGCDTGNLLLIEDIERSIGCALGWNPDAYFPFCFSEAIRTKSRQSARNANPKNSTRKKGKTRKKGETRENEQRQI